MTAWHGGDDLVLAVAAQNNNTIVVVHSVGPLILEPWIDHPNVTAVRLASSHISSDVLIVVNLLGSLGRRTRHRIWPCNHGCPVWRLEPLG